jgi:two-component system sensor histidine kinase AlgZ
MSAYARLQRGDAAERAELLPDFCSVPMALGLMLYGELLAVLLVVASPSPLHTAWERLLPLSALVVVVALLSAVLLCQLRRRLRTRNARLSVFGSWLLIVANAVTVAYAAGNILMWLDGSTWFPEDGSSGLVIRAGLISAIVAALMLRYLYLHRQWRAQVEAAANARFETLQARIRPHFLFNSMNTIASLTQTDPRLAEEVVEDLADLFRAALFNAPSPTTFAQEIELTRRYLNIESHRLGDRMRLEWDLDGVPSDAMMPPLALQPLVENAVYHGIQPSARPGFIRIVGRYRRGMVELSVCNSLPGPEAASGKPHKGNRVALENVSQRMEAMFPGSAKVSQSKRDGNYLVSLAFPYSWRES